MLRDCPFNFQRDFITILVTAKYCRKLTSHFGYPAVKFLRFYLWHCHLCSERESVCSFMCLPYGSSLLVNYCFLLHFVFKLTWSICFFSILLPSQSTRCSFTQYEHWIWCSEHRGMKRAICYVGIHKYAWLISVFVQYLYMYERIYVVDVHCTWLTVFTQYIIRRWWRKASVQNVAAHLSNKLFCLYWHKLRLIPVPSIWTMTLCGAHFNKYKEKCHSSLTVW